MERAKGEPKARHSPVVFKPRASAAESDPRAKPGAPAAEEERNNDMKRLVLWILAVLITLGAAVYQRLTGPTYPAKCQTTIGDKVVKASLLRSAENVADAEIKVRGTGGLEGYIEYMRYKTQDPWTKVPMEHKEGGLAGSLPKQPEAGKLAYKVVLVQGDLEVAVNGDKPVVIRFKGAVPGWVLIPHIIIMFLAMLFSTLAGLAAFGKAKAWPRFKLLPGAALFVLGIGAAYAIFKIVGIPKIFGTNLLWLCIPVSIGIGGLLAAFPFNFDHRTWAKGTAVLLVVGGFILGPLVQKFSFGVLWSGFPLGFDLTDNKTLIALIGWLVALFMMRKGKQARAWTVAAAVLLMAIYSIPHSVLGSELDYSKLTPPAKINVP
jgi:hypothetical protein